jgi:ABC-type hemin transport system ATPase subunit
VASVADRLVVISGGRIVAAGDTRELLAGRDDIEEYYFRLTEGTTPAAAIATGVAR